MNFQAIRVAQKTAGDGYVDGSGSMSASLESALAHTDESLEKIMSKLRERNLLDSTLVMITAKHGDSPIDPAKPGMPNPELIPKTVTSVHERLLAGLEQDGSVALLVAVGSGPNR